MNRRGFFRLLPAAPAAIAAAPEPARAAPIALDEKYRAVPGAPFLSAKDWNAMLAEISAALNRKAGAP